MIEQDADFGQPLSYEAVTKGLKELCPDIHFDLSGCTGQWHPMIGSRAGVFYLGRHMCSIDRGMIPEYKVWSMREQPVQVPVSEAHSRELPIQWAEIEPGSEFYDMGMDKARQKDDNWFYDEARGKLIRYMAYDMQMARDRVMRVGWRHTFERLVAWGLPGITRESLGKKFRIDMLKFPAGAPEEVVAQLFEE